MHIMKPKVFLPGPSRKTALMPPLEYIAGMKLQSGREKDIDDVALIIKKNITMIL